MNGTQPLCMGKQPHRSKGTCFSERSNLVLAKQMFEKRSISCGLCQLGMPNRLRAFIDSKQPFKFRLMGIVISRTDFVTTKFTET